MTTLHIQPENLHDAARQMTQNAAQVQSGMENMKSQMQQLAYAWQGPSSDEFNGEAQRLLSGMRQQAELLEQLGGRVERTASDWEQLDQRGASTFLSSGVGLLGFLPFSAGAIGLIPVMALPLSISSWQTGLPTWLGDQIKRLFPSFFPPASDPLSFHLNGPDDAGNPTPGAFASNLLNKFDQTGKPATPAAAIQNDPAPAAVVGTPPPPATVPQSDPTPAAVVETPPPPASGVFNDVPIKAQGDLYGSAACAPTSVSMVLDYFHNQDASRASATPQKLVDMLDNGDGTWGNGVSLSLMTDDLNELGYKNITVSDNNSLDSLATSLKDGPVIVTSGVQLIGGAVRDIQQAGSTMHAMVVKGINASSVLVNDPWSGVEKVFPRDTFSQMWNVGNNVIYSIRP